MCPSAPPPPSSYTCVCVLLFPNPDQETDQVVFTNFICLRASLLCVLVLPGAPGTAIDQSDADFTFCTLSRAKSEIRI